jgi:hypothetical protein
MNHYNQSFGLSFNLGFELNEFPFLCDKSWHNDMSPSFYFKVAEQYFVLWVDFEEVEQREEDGLRYTAMTAKNYGDDEHPEISCDDGEVVYSTEDVLEISRWLNLQLVMNVSSSNLLQ